MQYIAMLLQGPSSEPAGSTLSNTGLWFALGGGGIMAKNKIRKGHYNHRKLLIHLKLSRPLQNIDCLPSVP